MSHCILKTGVSPPRGLFTDISDTAECYWYWVKNELTGSWVEFKMNRGWSIAGLNPIVYHANDEEEVDSYGLSADSV
jgi:hypothetical protein